MTSIENTRKTAALPVNEDARLATLREYQILDTEREEAFDEIVHLAAVICSVPIAAISIVDADRQWFKSSLGLGVTETPRDISFCTHTILQPDIMVVTDATEDPRFQNSPLVTGEPYIRFYAGVPLVTPDGYPLGALCAIDRKARILTQDQLDALQVLAHQVVGRMLVTRRTIENERLIAEKDRLISNALLAAEIQAASDSTLRQLGAALECTTDGVILMDARKPDYPISYANSAFLTFPATRCRT